MEDTDWETRRQVEKIEDRAKERYSDIQRYENLADSCSFSKVNFASFLRSEMENSRKRYFAKFHIPHPLLNNIYSAFCFRLFLLLCTCTCLWFMHYNLQKTCISTHTCWDSTKWMRSYAAKNAWATDEFPLYLVKKYKSKDSPISYELIKGHTGSLTTVS